MASSATLGPAPAGGLKRHDIGTVRRNSLWTAVQQIANIAGGSIFAVVLAWVLPIEEYGVYSYAMALCTIGLSVTTAGLGGLGIKYILAEGTQSSRSVMSILLIRELFSVLTFVTLGAVSFTSHDTATTVASLIALSSLFFRALDAPELWYMAHMRSRRVATIRITCVFAALAVRVVSMFVLPNLWLFIGIYVAEAAVASMWILLRFHRESTVPAMTRPAWRHVGSMARESSPLALSMLANQVNLRADIVIIQPMLGSAAVGVYALAAQASEVAYLLPIVIMNSTLPVLLQALEESRESGSDRRYRRILQLSYDRAFQCGVAIALIVTAVCVSPVTHLVSAHLRPVFDVLVIHIWASPFVFMGAVYSKWIVAEGYLWSSLVRHSVGAVTNVVLVLVLLPVWGLEGAALATVISYAVANYGASFLGGKSRQQGYCMSRAMLSPALVPARMVRHQALAGRRRRRGRR